MEKHGEHTSVGEKEAVEIADLKVAEFWLPGVDGGVSAW